MINPSRTCSKIRLVRGVANTDHEGSPNALLSPAALYSHQLFIKQTQTEQLRRNLQIMSLVDVCSFFLCFHVPGGLVGNKVLNEETPAAPKSNPYPLVSHF